MSKKLLVVFIVISLAGFVISCSANNEDAKKTLATIPLQSATVETEASSTPSITIESTEPITEEFDYEIDIDQETNRVTGVWYYEDQTIEIDAVLLSNNYPEVLNVYRIVFSDAGHYEWWLDSVWERRIFDAFSLLSGRSSTAGGMSTSYVDDPAYMHMDRSENQSTVNSIGIIPINELPFVENLSVISEGIEMYDNAMFYDFPEKTAPDCYYLYDYPSEDGTEFISESLQHVDYYVVRECVDGLPVGLPCDSIQTHIINDTSDNMMIEVMSPIGEQYFDGNNTVCEIVKIPYFPDHLEVICADQRIMALEDVFEQVFVKLLPIISDEYTYSDREDYIYSVELVWMLNIVMNDQMDQLIEYDLVPYWSIGYHCNYICANGEEGVIHAPILINAIDGLSGFNGETVYEE